jgi:aryl-alcohol dehydrogenase-like predicted oxidoreductase
MVDITATTLRDADRFFLHGRFRRAVLWPMEHRTIGQTGIRVSPLCFGAMMLGQWGNQDHDDSVRVIHRALDAGINFIDTADVYSQGESEEIVGKALKGRRDEVVLATKFTGQMGEGTNRRGHSRKWVIEEVENSLRRLGTDYIDLYQAHRPDESTDIEELLSTLSDLIHQGKIRIIGSSTFPAHQIVEGQWAAERRGLERFRCEQPPYSIFVRGIERDVLPVCQQYGMGVIPWSPLAGGWLGGKYRKGEPLPTTGRARMQPQRFDPALPGNAKKYDLIEELAKIAADAGVSLVELAVGFVIAHPAVTAAIIGPRTMEQLEDQLSVLDLTLDGDILDRIDELVPPGTNLNEADAGWTPPSIADAKRRRR